MPTASGAIKEVSATIERWARWDDGARQRMNATWRDLLNRYPTLEGSGVEVCVEAVFGDRVVRVSTGPVKATSGVTGELVAFSPELAGDELEIEHSISLDGQQASARSVGLTIPGDLVRPWDLISRGRSLGGIAEISLLTDGMDYDNRFVLIRGDLLSPSFGVNREPVTTTLTDPRTSDSRITPEVVADATRWPSIGNGAVGKRYPLLLNGFDRVPCLPVYSVVPSPGKWLLCSGRSFGTPTVYVNGVAKAAGDGTYPWSKVETVDALGEPVVLIDFTSGVATWADNDVVHASITSSDASQSVVNAILDLLRGHTAFGSLGLNPDLFAEAEIRMPAWTPRAMLNSSGEKAVRAIDFVEGELLPSFPMLRMVYEGRGLGPVVVDRFAAPAGSLTAREFPLRERVGAIDETSKADLYNEFEIRYSYDLIANDYTKIKRFDASNSAACRLSQSKQFVGDVRAKTPIESQVITTDNVAEGVLSWLVSHFALPSYTVQWTADPWLFFRYRRGQNVLYTDEQIGFSNAPATIEGLSFSRRAVRVTLRVWHPFWSLAMSGRA